jgi:hypothetical protein
MKKGYSLPIKFSPGGAFRPLRADDADLFVRAIPRGTDQKEVLARVWRARAALSRASGTTWDTVCLEAVAETLSTLRADMERGRADLDEIGRKLRGATRKAPVAVPRPAGKGRAPERRRVTFQASGRTPEPGVVRLVRE